VGVFRQLMRTGGVVSDDARLRPSFCPSFFNVPDVCPEPVLVIVLSLSLCVCVCVSGVFPSVCLSQGALFQGATAR
jgi:hypothetical protein